MGVQLCEVDKLGVAENNSIASVHDMRVNLLDAALKSTFQMYMKV